MHDWLTHRVATTPQDTALVRASTGETLSFADVDALVDETAGALAALGVEAGEHLGVIAPTSVDAVRVAYAAMRLGVTLIPLSTRATAPEVAAKLDAADVSTLVCADETASLARDAVSEASVTPPLASVGTVDADAAADAETADSGSSTASDAPAVTALSEAPVAEVTPATWAKDDTLAMLFTSGTTGRPKAVPLSLENVFASAMASAFRLGVLPGDRWLVALSLHHAGGLTPVLRGPLYGMTVVLREEFDAGGTADDLDRYDVTGVSLVPTMLRRMLDARGTLADSLRVVLLGGAPAPPSLVERCRDYAIPVHPTYGMTETASQISTATPAEAYDDPETVGRPLFTTDVTVLDEDLAPLSAGEVGELAVAGPTVTRGYYGDDAATEAAFCEYGLRTGDVGYVDEAGRLYVHGRLDDRIVTGGENVAPGEVADVVRAHPAVDDVAVVGVPDPEWGERVAALVVPTAPDALSAADVVEYCRGELAGFKLPRTVAFAAELPRTVSGTVDREAVRERLREATADAEATDTAFEFDAVGDGDEDGNGDDVDDGDGDDVDEDGNGDDAGDADIGDESGDDPEIGE